VTKVTRQVGRGESNIGSGVGLGVLGAEGVGMTKTGCRSMGAVHPTRMAVEATSRDNLVSMSFLFFIL